MKRILYLDPGAKLGWALRLTPKKVMYGTEDFSCFTGVDGRAHSKFNDWFRSFLRDARPDMIVSEAPIFRGAYSEYLYGFHVLIALAAFEMKIATGRVNLSTIKAQIAGHGKADKAKMIATMRELGYDPETEHEADALAILTFSERQHVDEMEFTGKAISIKPRLLNTLRRQKRKRTKAA